MPRASTSPAAFSGGNQSSPDKHSPVQKAQSSAERLPEVGDDRAIDPEVEIPFGPLRPQPMEIVRHDVQAAGEPQAAVDDQDLAMIPQVQVGHPARRERREEPRDRHPGAA